MKLITFPLAILTATLPGITANAKQGPVVDPIYPFYAFIQADATGKEHLSLSVIAPITNYNPRIYWHPECVEGYVRFQVLIKHNRAYRLAYEEAAKELREIRLPEWISSKNYQLTSESEKQKICNWIFSKLNTIVRKPRKQIGGKSLEQMLHLARRERPKGNKILVSAPLQEIYAWEKHVREYGIEYFDKVQILKERAIVYSEIMLREIATNIPSLFFPKPGSCPQNDLLTSSSHTPVSSLRHGVFSNKYSPPRSNKDTQEIDKKIKKGHYKP
ncbi:hypothetical protein D6779_00160 [Candidatus Parcubacteria bacterium]|nr:MAG: hypothetical protein D6779_00160 [Candidatus Parcubacteria bacterium]